MAANDDGSDDSRAARGFRAFLTALVRVPKRELDEQEAKDRKRRAAAKARGKPIKQRA